MTQIDHIRKLFFEEGHTIIQIAKIFSCDRKTVRKYIKVDDFNQLAPCVKWIAERQGGDLMLKEELIRYCKSLRLSRNLVDSSERVAHAARRIKIPIPRGEKKHLPKTC